MTVSNLGGDLFGQISAILCVPPNAVRTEKAAAVVEWEDGEHTHLVLQVLAKDGSWEPLVSVALQDCLTPAVRPLLRQFPLFRLAWYGQVGEPSNTPQRLVPEQLNRVSSDATSCP